MVIIKSIKPNSIAHRAGIKPGKLLSINGFVINDFLDYDYYNKEKNLTLQLEADNEPYTISIINKDYTDLGLEFDSFLMDTVKSCKNKCIFCFIDQNPPGMRETIYFKDDDHRMSFLTGNYITLTNLTAADIDRIIALHLPVNVSLHTANPALRCRMMNNRFAGERIADLRRLTAAGNTVNVQIVLCKGLNDGDELRFTLDELLKMGVESAAVVPVGLTKYRDGLFPLKPIDRETAAETIDIIDFYQRKFLQKFGRKTVYASDEMFIKAGRNIPGADYYEDYPQYDNGVGFMRNFADEFLGAVRANVKYRQKVNSDKTILVTGTSSHSFVKNLADYAKALFPGINCEVFAVKNNFYGGEVSVTGLLTGQDIIEQIGKDKCKGESADTTILLLRDMFKADTELFLDNITKTDVENALGMKAEIIDRDGKAIFKRICGVKFVKDQIRGNHKNVNRYEQ
jgi:putative radical SAM enzyme (TIGR03279 family)